MTPGTVHAIEAVRIKLSLGIQTFTRTEVILLLEEIAALSERCLMLQDTGGTNET